MRRAAVLGVLVVGSVAVLPPTPASAHICPVSVQIAVGRSGTVTVAATVEGTAVPDVEIDVPDQLRIDGVTPPNGWKAQHAGQTIRLTGPPITPYTCAYFPVAVTPTGKGVFGIRVVQRDARGNVVANSYVDATQPPNPTFVTTVYAGVKPPSTSTGGGVSVVTIAGIALVALGGAALAGLALRSRRARRVEDRVEAFKKQVRDRGA
jgi:hypothetical protein